MGIDRVVDIADQRQDLSLLRGFLLVSRDREEIGRVLLDDICALIAADPTWYRPGHPACIHEIAVQPQLRWPLPVYFFDIAFMRSRSNRSEQQGFDLTEEGIAFMRSRSNRSPLMAGKVNTISIAFMRSQSNRSPA